MAEPRPAALPPAQRTVGQLVAETIRLYGDHFWLGILLGLPFLLIDVVSLNRSVLVQTVVAWVLGPLVCAAYVRACMLVTGASWSWRAFATALIVYIPFPVLLRIFVLPGIVWFALLGLSVPVYLDAKADGIAEALRKGLVLGRADLVHAVGGLATLCIVYGLSRGVLLILLHTQGDQAQKIAIALSDVVLSPILYLGGALLYVDQSARVE
ncbi:MAG: hypothetical protein ABUS54_11430 [Actinomycetota bacterium]